MGWMTLLDVVTAIGQVMLNLSLAPDIYNVHRRKSTGEMTALPLVSMLVNCHVWLLYGILRNSIFPVAVTQGFGELVAFVCNIIYFRWSTPEERKGLIKLYLMALPFYCALTVFFVLSEANVTSQTHHDASTVLGYVGVIINVCLFVSPLARLKHVIETKSAASIPINLSLMMFVSSVLWVATGLLDSDYFITGLNVAGVVLGAIQMVLYYNYRPKRGIQDQEDIEANGRMSDVHGPVKGSLNTAVSSPIAPYKQIASPIVVTA
ncbi:hypothetical protein PHYBOEH_009091 [Phytophthora boehmeriae]|uniref:Sugar transporter SWEET1 n=1 Tax=Phytophthora boehmeriae TaxID=109152 RepID=A0A8T1VVD5_9STRA|nr:hypothetical protein PHYBOEH_009091 [Phytophthora boehmeriae]